MPSSAARRSAGKGAESRLAAESERSEEAACAAILMAQERSELRGMANMPTPAAGFLTSGSTLERMHLALAADAALLTVSR